MEEQDTIYLEKSELLKALSHPLRLRIVRGLLHCGCRNVGCMEANTGQSQSCISQHLMRLKAAGIVKAARSGNEVYYEVSDPRAAAVVAALFGECEEEYHCTTSQ
ncbi:ArsR/SmtB family transcription factor [Pseudoflavonifractor phocaeensis]|uniref:ArsR/SmtB family transcription factor n=1 Tax=Pseudoflavonifractor phocaeensis TaxID=1870988 RepID=UPI00195BF2F9|nr:metalloregulator ArsR/SmtB family transcription factor [Pseudoflavonifractor phocaeensis]MBM6925722.1 winged helix-turn-helix transcriptional regulator [Pseudoflavonifractor phocaeensis]